MANNLKFNATLKAYLGTQDPQPLSIMENMDYTKAHEAYEYVAAASGDWTVSFGTIDTSSFTVITTTQPVTVKLNSASTGTTVNDFMIISGDITAIRILNTGSTQAECGVSIYKKYIP